jgi:3-phenylpropionate/cinnamic acid dioxygenase small subunit
MISAAESIRRRIHLTARHLDDGDYAAFLKLFTADGEYRVEANAPELQNTMTWLQMTRDELAERCAQVSKQEWQIGSYQQTRLLSIDIIDNYGDAAHSSTNFVIYQTDSQGRTECYVAGRYEDDWSATNGEWELAARCVELKTRLLSPMSPLPL